MPIMVKTYMHAVVVANLMRAVDQKPDNHLEWPNAIASYKIAMQFHSHYVVVSYINYIEAI